MSVSDVLPVVGDVGMTDLLEDVVEEVEEAALQGLIEPLPFSEWFSRALDLFSDTLSWIMSVPYLRFFAVFAAFFVVCNLCVYLVRTGRRLAR